MFPYIVRFLVKKIVWGGGYFRVVKDKSFVEKRFFKKVKNDDFIIKKMLTFVLVKERSFFKNDAKCYR